MPTTRINCPNCRQPVTADITQLFDVNEDPNAKQRLLSGAVNVIQCPHCGYQGAAATPIVYHDPEKELLLTYFPPELNMPVPEQERLIGPLINQVVNRLPQEKRKGYLLRPQTMFTMQGLIERILEGEGITREMLQSQQQRLNLIQRLANVTSQEVLEEVAKQEDALIDEEFFGILNRLVETSMMGGDEQSARHLAGLQRALLPITTAGKKIQEQSQEVEAAIKSLQAAGSNLTRDTLLDLVIEAPTDTRLQVIASLARPGMDYEFFELLSKRIENAEGEQRQKLENLREQLLDITRTIDQQIEARTDQARQMINSFMEVDDIEQVAQENMPMFDEFFMQVLNQEVNSARKQGDLERLQKLQIVAGVIQQASEPPLEVAVIENLLELPDEAARGQWLEENQEQVTPELMDALTALLAQVQASEDKDLYERMHNVYRSVLRFSMQKNMRQG